MPEPCDERRPLGRAHFAVVAARHLQEGLRLPALHTRGGHRHPIDSATLDPGVAADLFKAPPPEHLTRTGNMLEIRKLVRVAVILRPIGVFYEWRARHAEFRQLCELAHQELAITRFEGDVGVEIADQIKIPRL